MKKIILFLALLLMPSFVFGAIDQNIYFGLVNNNGVKVLQQYLISKGFLAGNATGNFYSLTFNAVKKYQASKNINATGYVGPLTRQAINADLLSPNTVNSKPPVAAAATTNPAPLTGSLNLLQSTSYAGQSVTAPQTKFKLADFSLTNNTNEAINLKTIQVDLATGANLYITNLYVTNLYVVYGSNKTAILNTVSHNNYLTINFQLPAGQNIDLSVYGDVNSSIPLNSAIKSSILVAGVSAVSGIAVSTNSNTVLSGQSITFGTGSLTLSQDSSTPSSKIVAANQRVVAGKFQFKAANDSYNISELKFIIPSPPVNPIISGAILSDTATQVLLAPKSIPATYDSGGYVFDFNVNIPVSLNSSKYLTLYYDLSQVTFPNSTNINITPVLVYVKATNSRGILVDGAAADYNMVASYGGIALPIAGITVNGLYIFKSVPTLTAVSSNTSAPNGSNINLYTFNIGADPKGDVSVKQLMFKITINDPNRSYPHLNKFTFLKGNNDYTSSVAIANTVNNSYIGLTNNSGIGIGTNDVVLTFNREETIPAGTTQTYILKAYANNFVNSSLGADSVSTYIPSDAVASNNGSYLRMVFTNIYGLSQTPADIYVANYNLLWSDKSALAFSAHSDLNGSSTSDWYNGFDVLNLPLPAQTVTAK